jgi:hypothetical protein
MSIENQKGLDRANIMAKDKRIRAVSYNERHDHTTSKLTLTSQ